ncbi:hypothetical protein [Kribbella sp. CA-293567]|uniref:hypothetical protein n=1 Tax=Kribbella sp. CA-293567 TaxID=3002436 RepID=UPI0022DE7D1A|nr:hypothetical protein [Kribbella sp. CA-293567]WBQ01817.1 hypothetical protein OX958_17620 [Kribbella sp. CA-293567]
MRRTAIPAALLSAALLLSACGGSSEDGGMPVPVEGGDAPTITLSGTPSAQPTAAPTKKPSAPVTTAAPPPPAKGQVTVVAGNFASNPAVQGLVKSYPVYFSALVARDADIIKNNFPAYFYADVQQGIDEAKRNGWVMKPPGSVVVMGTSPQPPDVIRVKLCRSQTTQYWNPGSKSWVVAAKGAPQVIDMIRTGLGWLPYQLAPSTGVNCAKVRFPA